MLNTKNGKTPLDSNLEKQILKSSNLAQEELHFWEINNHECDCKSFKGLKNSF